MKLRKLYLKNFRCFDEVEIEFDPLLTVLVADNGQGKTSILDAIAIGFGRMLTRLPKVSGILIKETDLRIDDKNKLTQFVRYFLEAETAENAVIQWSTSRAIVQSTRTAKAILDHAILTGKSAGLKQLNQYTDTLINRENTEVPFVMPVIAYYGTNRVFQEEIQRRRNFRKQFSRFEALDGALDARARFKASLEWFNAMEDDERRRQQETKSFDYRLPELETVREAIQSMLPEFSNPRIESRPMRFVIDRKLENATRTYRITQLSDGYRAVLALVMDLARRMAEANPPDITKTNPLHQPALVLIDEIDLHLHPSWQQRILEDLRRTFPNTQFIVTTHSPQVLSTVKSENIRNLKIRDGKYIVEIPAHEIYAQESRVALEDVFDVPSRPPLEVNQQLQEYLKLLEDKRDETTKANQLRRTLEARLGAGDPQLQLADMLILRNQALRLKGGQ
jgi:predicted ATP-binding protein involved in virulence